MGRRTLLLIAALVVAVLGTVLVFLYANNAKNEAAAGQEQVQVLVAKTQIAVGTTGATADANGAFETRNIAATDQIAGALGNSSPIQNLVALVPIYPGQQIIPQQWGASVQTSGLSLPPGTVAMSITVSDPDRVAGFVGPGSNVALFTTGKLPTDTELQSRVLLPTVQVLAVGSSTALSKSTGQSSGNAEALPNTMFTLAVTQDQMQKILLVTKAQTGYTGITFALLDKNSKIDAKRVTTPKTLFTP
jgi:pilus assembly protein CpaB